MAQIARRQKEMLAFHVMVTNLRHVEAQCTALTTK